MRSLIRIKPKSVPYQRAGIVFASVTDWLEIDADTLAPEQTARLAADERLTIESCVDGSVEPELRVWEPIEPQIRLLAADQLLVLTEDDWAELKGDMPDRPILTGDGSGAALPPIDTLATAIDAVGSELFALGVNLDGDVIGQLMALVAQADAAIAGRDAEITVLAAQIDLLNSTHTPSATDSVGGTGDPAGPAGPAGESDPTSAATPPSGGTSAPEAAVVPPPTPTPAAPKGKARSGAKKPG